MNSKKQSGFTLIELLVVIAIIGLLASVVLVALNNARQKSRDAKRIADMNQIAKALELYFSDNNTYPTSSVGRNFSALVNNPSLWGQPAISPKYIATLPSAPVPSDGNCGAQGATGNGVNDYYVYPATQSTTNAYTITFCLGQQTGGLPAGAHTLTQSGFR